MLARQIFFSIALAMVKIFNAASSEKDQAWLQQYMVDSTLGMVVMLGNPAAESRVRIPQLGTIAGSWLQVQLAQ